MMQRVCDHCCMVIEKTDRVVMVTGDRYVDPVTNGGSYVTVRFGELHFHEGCFDAHVSALDWSQLSWLSVSFSR